jgi:hypothetical protein
MSNNSDEAVKPLPDPELCRTVYWGEKAGMFECLVKSSERCPYAVRLASDVFCRHPDGRTFEVSSQTPG